MAHLVGPWGWARPVSALLAVDERYVCRHVLVVVDGEGLALADQADRAVLGGEIHVVGESVTQRPQAVLDQLLHVTYNKYAPRSEHNLPKLVIVYSSRF